MSSRTPPNPPTAHSVLVLQGGPDSEREISLRSGMTVSSGLRDAGFQVEARTIDTIDAKDLSAMPGDVIFPILHGGWGEGGPLQDILEADGRPFVGSRARPARQAMDKIATKFAAAGLGIPTPPAALVDARDPGCSFAFPVVLKPVHEGSTVGLFVCRDERDWAKARAKIDQERAAGLGRAYMIEPCICRRDGRKARELTVGLLDGVALPTIEITPAIELYDYEAKYNRDDTRYTVGPQLPVGVGERIGRQTVELAKSMGIRHLARADFMLDDEGVAWFLEINTMPGFTDHSLVPMACRHLGLGVPEVMKRLVQMALRDHGRGGAMGAAERALAAAGR